MFSHKLSGVLCACFMILCCLEIPAPLQAAGGLTIELTRGIHAAIPIAILPFTQQESFPEKGLVSEVIQQDLAHSGRFRVYDNQSLPHNNVSEPNQLDFSLLQQEKMDYAVVGHVTPGANGFVKVKFYLVDVYRKTHPAEEGKRAQVADQDQILLQHEFDVPQAQMRHITHTISNLVYEKLTGEKGIFTTKIAYIEVIRGEGGQARHYLKVADIDGYGPQVLLGSPEPIMSPTWSPDGSKLAYVSFEHRKAQIYISELRSGSRMLVSQFPGINGAPAWSPDGSKLAVVLSKDGSPNIYVLNLATRQLRQLTHDQSINTEPAWNSQGNAIAFTSDRGGGPQIYQVDLNSEKIQRLTYTGNYNARPRFTPDGRGLVVLHRNDRGYCLAKMDLYSGSMQELTSTAWDESPSVAPNGRMILYSTKVGDKHNLAMVSMDGEISVQLPATIGNVQEPAWSPFLS